MRVQHNKIWYNIIGYDIIQQDMSLHNNIEIRKCNINQKKTTHPSLVTRQFSATHFEKYSQVRTGAISNFWDPHFETHVWRGIRLRADFEEFLYVKRCYIRRFWDSGSRFVVFRRFFRASANLQDRRLRKKTLWRMEFTNIFDWWFMCSLMAFEILWTTQHGRVQLYGCTRAFLPPGFTTLRNTLMAHQSDGISHG